MKDDLLRIVALIVTILLLLAAYHFTYGEPMPVFWSVVMGGALGVLFAR